MSLRPAATFLLLLGVAGAAAGIVPQQARPENLPLDMRTWYRRDYSRCNGAGRVTVGGAGITIEVDSSALKYWQLPTLLGPLPVNERAGWVRRCDRPPASFARDAIDRARGMNSTIHLRDYPYVSWRWRVQGTIDDAETADAEGRIQSAGDDFAAKVGFQMLPEGSEELRELAYVWTRTIPEDTLLVQESGALFWQYRFYRLVVESGEEHVGTWREVTRNLAADYKRVWPDEEPGILLRVFLMTDGDNTGVSVAASYDDLVLHRSPPRGVPTGR